MINLNFDLDGRQPSVCPVCEGKVDMSSDFYITASSTTSGVHYETCRTCNGTGVVWPPKDDNQND